MPDLTDVLLRLADPALAPPDPMDGLQHRVRSRRRRRRMVKAAVTVTCVLAVGLPAFGVLADRRDPRPVQLETSQTTLATVPPTPDRPSGRFAPTWLPGDLKIQTEVERQAGNGEAAGATHAYNRHRPTGESDRLLLSIGNDSSSLDVDRDVARYAGARRVEVLSQPALLLPVVAGRAETTVTWSWGGGPLGQVRGSGVTEEELLSFARGAIPAGFRESIGNEEVALPPATPRRYEVGTNPFRGPASYPASGLPSVRILAIWDEPLTPGTPETVRDRPGVLSTNQADTSVAWLERPGLLVTVTGTNVGHDDVRRVAAGLREQSMEEVLRRPEGGRTLLARGGLESGPYELWAAGGPSGPCLELAHRSLARACSPDPTATIAELPITIGSGVAFGPVVREAARVRLELAGGKSVETEAVGASAGQGAAFYVVALPRDFATVVAVVALGPNGQVLRRTPVG